VVDTVLIAAGGYIVNDLMDQKADTFNKPEKIYIGKGKITPLIGWVYYSIVVLAGLGIAYYIADNIDKLHLLTIYPVAVGLLLLYSSHLKRLPLLGNLIVSIFCAFVPGIIWYAEHEMLNYFVSIPNYRYNLLMHLFPAYISFAFLSTFVREIIKDIEDMDGDMKSSYQTLPIAAGVERAKVIAFFLGIVLLGSYGFWFIGFPNSSMVLLGSIIIISLILPTIYILRRIYHAKSKHEFTSISKMLKYLMIVSLFLFLCIPFIL
jgi:4-hydroxybenzoate polyprenyltransferase